MAVSTLYVNNILPKDSTKIIAPDLQLPAGSVVQVVHGTGATDPETSTTSTTYVPTGTYASITPKYANSKIIIQVTGGMMYMPTAGSTMSVTIYRNGAAFITKPSDSLTLVYVNAASTQIPTAFSCVDTPNTLASTEYKVYFKSSGPAVQFNNHAFQCALITLTEIAQ